MALGLLLVIFAFLSLDFDIMTLVFICFSFRIYLYSRLEALSFAAAT
jgi:hypothetical protein